MQTEVKINDFDFRNQNVYVGIDAHLKSWNVTIMLDNISHKTFSQDPNAENLGKYLKKNFPGGEYYSAYEAGFCGFSIHRNLTKEGIKNMIVNPADIPTSDKEKRQKTDPRDSRKIAKTLRSGDLKAIYVPQRETEEERGLLRYRRSLVKEISRNKNRIKSLLYNYGIPITVEFETPSKYWSRPFTIWLKQVKFETKSGQLILLNTMDTVDHLRNKLLLITKEIKELS